MPSLRNTYVQVSMSSVKSITYLDRMSLIITEFISSHSVCSAMVLPLFVGFPFFRCEDCRMRRIRRDGQFESFVARFGLFSSIILTRYLIIPCRVNAAVSRIVFSRV
jgi:hypothetical protein